jgi:hypothetical protein
MRKICPLDISSIIERPVGMGFNFTTYKILEKKKNRKLNKKAMHACQGCSLFALKSEQKFHLEVLHASVCA